MPTSAQPNTPAETQALPVAAPAVVALFTAVASQAALIAALLYFFGSTYTNAFYGYFGVESGSLGFSTTDYVMRSLNTTLTPAIACAIAILAGLYFAKHLVAIADFVRQRPQLKRTTAVAIAVVIASCLVIIVNGVSDLPTNHYSRGYPLPVAVLGLAVAMALGRSLVVSHTDIAADRWWSMIVAAFVLAGVLWATDMYAAVHGEKDARDKVANLRSQTSSDFVLYSANRLALSGPSIQADPLTTDGSRYHFQYSGLRLLIRTPREYIVLPAEWQKGRDAVIVVPVDDSTRFDIVPHCGDQC